MSKKATLLAMAIQAVAIFNAELEAFKSQTGDYDSLVDEDNEYFHCEPAEVKGSGRGFKVVFRYAYAYDFMHNHIIEEKSAPIWVREDVDNYHSNAHTIEGDGYKDYITMFKKGIRKGKRFFAMPVEKIDKLQGV